MATSARSCRRRARVADLETRLSRLIDLAVVGALTPEEAAERRTALDRDLNAARRDLVA